MDTAKTPVRLFEHIDDVKNFFTSNDVYIFLDYDGTLTPIVATPDKAILTDDMRDTVNRLSQKYTVSIVSGRATKDVKEKVALDHIFYAGSHGFEIVSPDGGVKINEKAEEVSPVIDEAYRKLSYRVKDIEGALVEHVKYTITAHHRNVDEKDAKKIEEAVDAIIKEYPELKKSIGKKVFELKPKTEWHKGKAVGWILETLNFDAEKDKAVYIGDDTTDEDAFREVKDNGFGILVAESIRASDARYVIKNTKDVKKVLEMFMEWKS